MLIIDIIIFPTPGSGATSSSSGAMGTLLRDVALLGSRGEI